MNWTIFTKPSRCGVSGAAKPFVRLYRWGNVVVNRSAADKYFTGVNYCQVYLGDGGEIGLKPVDTSESTLKMTRTPSGTITFSGIALAKHLGVYGKSIKYHVSMDGGIIALTPVAESSDVDDDKGRQC